MDFNVHACGFWSVIVMVPQLPHYQSPLDTSWSRSLDSQPGGTDDLVINPAIGCHNFPPGPRLPSQLYSITAVWSLVNNTVHIARVCEQLAWSRYMKVERKWAISWTRVQHSNHYTTMTQCGELTSSVEKPSKTYDVRRRKKTGAGDSLFDRLDNTTTMSNLMKI